ncbi:MAG: hypothetical protein M1347_01720 [Chloroflexi bacterium]|nr:hypothetical protein [Chloroflexota bacterium]
MIPEVRAFRDSLRAEEQEAFDNLCQAASENYRMMDRVGLVIPLEKILFAVLIEQQKQIEHLKQVLDTNKVIPGSLNGS